MCGHAADQMQGSFENWPFWGEVIGDRTGSTPELHQTEWDMCLAFDEPWCWVHQAPTQCPHAADVSCTSTAPFAGYKLQKDWIEPYDWINWTGLDQIELID